MADSAEAAVPGAAPQAGAVRPPVGLRGLHAGPLQAGRGRHCTDTGGPAAGRGAAAVAGQLPALLAQPAARLGRDGRMDERPT